MFWDEAQEQAEYWDEFPPVHILVRHALGYKGASPAAASGGVLDDAREIASMFGGA